jgi:hypothetical protein
MYSYREQLEVIKRIRIQDGQLLRMDCPFCGGRNSFGIRKSQGLVQWGCFRASCQIKGIKSQGLSITEIKNYDKRDTSSAHLGKPIPTPLVSINGRDAITAYLQSVHSLQAHEEGLVKIVYSPTEDRVLFMYDGDEGATGRALTGVSQYNPKWIKYGDVSHLFTCGNGPVGVIVEDAPSACATGVVRGYTGISLLGTKLTLQHKLELHRFDRILVCLDPDAAQTGLDMVRRLSGTVDASLRLIKDDLKYFPPNEIEAILASSN